MVFYKKGAIENFILWHIFFMSLEILFMTTSRNSSAKGEKNAENNNRSKRNKQGKTAKEIVKRHLSDENDKITKEDFETLKIDYEPPRDNSGPLEGMMRSGLKFE